MFSEFFFWNLYCSSCTLHSIWFPVESHLCKVVRVIRQGSQFFHSNDIVLSMNKRSDRSMADWLMG